MRAFISVELTDEIKKNITELVNGLKDNADGIKWVEPKNLHITLKFLGWVEDRNLDNLIELTAKAVANTGSFRAKFEELGTFPEGKTPRVIWVGTAEGGDALCKLAKSLETTLSQAGFKSEAREPRPHITIGRVKERKGAGRVKEKIDGMQNARFGEMIVDRVCIMKSTLKRSGPVYEIFKEVKL
jgi:2'-5' RNA ligase